MAVRSRVLDGQLIWVGLIPLAAALGVAARWLPEKKFERAGGEDGNP
jgi:hypothetical protein